MMYITMLLLLGASMCSYSFFDYDRAIAYAQKNLWQDAGNILNRIVTKDPENSELLYDAGVAAYNSKDYQQAKTYFESAAQHDKAPKALKAQAYFNKGNAHVVLEELKEALLSYEQALMINPDDQQAKHNHEVVKKMLEQKEQEQQQDKKSDKQNQKDQSKDQNRDQQKDKKRQGQNSKSSDGQDSSDGKQQDDLNNSEADDEKEDAERDDRKDEGLDQERDQENGQENGADQEENKPQEDKERNERGDSDQNPESNEEQGEQQKESKHESPSDKNGIEQQQQDKQGEQKEQEIDDEKEDPIGVALDPRLERVLEKRSDRDAQLNKQMVRALVSRDMKGSHGQNCW